MIAMDYQAYLAREPGNGSQTNGDAVGWYFFQPVKLWEGLEIVQTSGFGQGNDPGPAI
jgi:hypothetical protein